MEAWELFLNASNAEMRRNDNNRGLAYTPDPKALTVDLVMEYLTGFAWRGCGASEVTAAVQRDERGVKRALAQLVADGRLTYRESTTRGPKASKRKTYFPAQHGGGPVTVSLPDYCDEKYLADRPNEYGAGGGRKVCHDLFDQGFE